ncbi:extracellular solute-binding protein [Cryptosporangium aurantiacum]|uniref:N,N'-diacetylchitobiose transport system substrate-binding protein n=1 Tax=Cryptosporangium aurantiacum TaxID=134849 RepID=A0A1M7JGQ5_9ACTN|nr:extracellular solute-binding protein [Cryptosporangium aurantiacum]SHM52138.1 N,N'-diacetylchitobiose transport system substrate-binding protein [Cryptosporangium aurantiacum]
MGVRRALTVGITALVTASLALSGCSSSDDSAGDGGTKKLTVWLMTGSAPDALVDEINTEFTKAHEGWTVDYQVQQWDGIQDKLTTALASNTPPDIVELGNTQAPRFVESGALADLTDAKSDLGGDNWLEGLAATGEKDGKTFATPFYAANRIVVYRKSMFAKAGITAPPKTIDELIAAGKKLQTANASNKQFQALYLPGQSWYTLLSWVWARGGDVAKQDGDKWTGTLDTPEAQQGFTDYANIYKALSKGPVDQDEANPQQSTVFAKGNVAMFIGLPWEIATATAAEGGNPKLADDIATFAIPGPTGPAPVFLGGSNLGVAAASPNQDAATDWLKLMLSEKHQTTLAGAGVVPALDNLGDGIYGDNEAAKVMASAATNGGKVTPVTPAWAAVESGTNPIKNAMTKVLRGTDVATASKEASTSITETMAKAK